MGDPAELNREMGHLHFRSSEVGDFKFSACESELGSFHFEMGHHSDATGTAADTSTLVSHGVEAFFELSDAAKVFCAADSKTLDEAGSDPDAFPEEGDELMMGWVSPRISFSQDLPMEVPAVPQSSRSFPEKRKRQGGEGGELNDGYSSEFEFLSNCVVNAGASLCQAKDTMLSADELFSDGKLLPMQVQEMASPNGELDMQGRNPSVLRGRQTDKPRCNEAGMHSGKLTLHADERIASEVNEMLMARHLSLDLPRPNSSSTRCGLATLASLSVDNSPCSSPPRSSAPPSNACIATSSASPALQKAGSKYTSKIKDFFKPKRVSSPISPQLTRDNSITSISTCRIPIPPRSFWPFSRSNSAGESKTSLPSLPPRSNSAGDRNTPRVVAKKINNARILELNKNSCISHGQAIMVAASEDEFHNSANYMDVNSATDCTDVGSLSNLTETAKQVNTEEDCATSTSSQQAQKSSGSSRKGKASGSPGRGARKRYMYTTTNFLRGSPGRRGGMNSAVKTNPSRIVLKNLERCSDRKLCRETSGRRTVAYPVALRVSPVINVAVYRGKGPSSGMFGLKSLFSSKKEKAKEKDAAINNWRAGA